ncbi:MAG: hypothetical protein WBV80_27095 [Mycobacterium sp.]
MNRGGARHARATAQAKRTSHLRVSVLALGGVLILAGAAIVAFYVAPTRPARPTPQVSATANASAPPTPTAEPDRGGLVGEFTKFQTALHARVGVVVRAVGTGPVAPMSFGGSDFSDQPAWSTIKIPLVIASMRLHNNDHPTASMVAAITESDNAAAEAIWEGLGDPTAAAAAVGKVLHDVGDPTTVESRKLRPEYTAFGQTNWSLTNQAYFLASAACDPHNQPVIDLMGQVTGDQRWGLGSLPDAKIKGGWGPSPSGRYLVRQIAVVPTGARGSTVVAMAAVPDSGSFADGTRVLTQIGNWLQAHMGALPAAKCRS